jgi:UDP-N-acetylglucosamine diphosphorylase/glucosamine-1-phosphate N-acetyltransferase
MAGCADVGGGSDPHRDFDRQFLAHPCGFLIAAGTLFVNAAFPAWLYPRALRFLEENNFSGIQIKGEILLARPNRQLPWSPEFHALLTQGEFGQLEEITEEEQPVWLWDLLDLIAPGLDQDLKLWQSENVYLKSIPGNLSTVDERHIFIHNTAQISKYVHLDASRGPLVIDKDVRIGPFCTLEGPLYIGKRSTLKPGTHIRHSVVGSVCNLGGEIKGSVLHRYTNKSHAGFLGDSLVGSWVNLGAGTTTSNLKNNYQPIRVSWDGNNHETGRQFLGSVIGDHSKTAIGVRLNTGTFIGPFCNVFQADFPPRAIPAFSWGNGTHDLEKAIHTAKTVMLRRNINMSPEEEALIRQLAEDITPFTQF